MKRLLYIDIVKVVAIIMVIMCHIPLLYSIDISQKNVGIEWIISKSIGSMGVPLFLMCTGVLVLSKKLDCIDDIKTFYKKNFGGIMLTGIIWYVIYYFSSLCYNINNFSFTELIRSILLINKPEIHLWYIRIVLMYYAFMPLINYILRQNKKVFIGIVILFFSITFGKNAWDIIINHAPYPTTPLLSSLSYFVYMAIGYYLSRCSFKIISGIIVDFALIVLGMFFVLYMRVDGLYYLLWYDNPFLLAASVGMFLLIQHICDYLHLIETKVVIELSRMTYGIYLFHMIVLTYIGRWIVSTLALPSPFMYIFCLGMCMMISCSVIWLTKQVPCFSKILFRY